MVTERAETGNGYYRQVRPEIARLISGHPSRILEVGCANGAFKGNITWPCAYSGVEPFPEAAQAARENGITVYEGNYEAVASAIPEGAFDLIICNDVMEHMADPWSFLADIRKKLAVGGEVIGSVPNVRYLLNLAGLLFRKDWRYVEAGVLDRTHLRFFTLKSLRRLFEECGYAVDLIRPSGPDRFRWLKRLLALLVWPAGTDVLYMQLAFRIRPLP